MARYTQYIGLPPAALKFIEEEGLEQWLTYQGSIGIAGEPVFYRAYKKKYEPEFDPPYEKIFFEVTQWVPWSSGPMIFTKLVDVMTGRTWEWTAEEIDQYF